MLKFDIRKQPDSEDLIEVLVNKLVEEANEVREALVDENISSSEYLQEILDVQQTLFAIFGQYKAFKNFDVFEHAMEEHNKKLATSHKEKYGLGDIQYIGYVDLNKPGDDPIEKLENKCENYSKQLKELINKNYDVENTNRVQEAKIEELRGIILNLKENIDRKNKKIESLKYIAQDLENTNRMLQEQLKETQDKLRRVQDNCKARIESDRHRIQDLESKLAECDENTLRAKDEEINKLRNELNTARRNFEWMRCECSKDNKKLREELQHKNTYIDDINKLNDRVIGENDKFKKEIKELKEKAELERVKKEEKIIKISELEANLVEYADEVCKLNKELNELQYSKDNLVEENMDLKHKLSTETVTGQNKKLEFLEKKYNLSMEANRQLREEIQTLRIENGEYRDIINRIENYINELKTQQMD